MESLKQWPRLVWIDLEMSGLNVQRDKILEIACVITDSDLNIVAMKEPIVVGQNQGLIEEMDQWNILHHTQSGLIDELRKSSCTIEEAEREILLFVKEYCEPEKSPLCGNSVWMDRFFLQTYMPLLEQYLYYRIIDVSTVKQLVNFWYGMPDKELYKKRNAHRALDDIKESIEELKFYRDNFFIKKRS
ncbi:TPA: oligoribonuclease [Candidatus Dependentiae bacterium]|nr:MAG: Oligoribonuclease [candidate division TM6 bacterium GW2011_GWF2_36_131]KKQ03783.1 MAG: Oligoribonuclease [candidate division TM6 bacterium GW2011_GWE2_36_25]KKQ19929.1 MAG: Oligoribonuclease [candidate division TM6 bacterium GW2011_GWA2_36_9]HBR70549.1 oligoribonuclease [Candidatus Dependentiae bacterium]HCU00735.1 oligoribonuclease [Candidatus Dependentiae bacterium]